MRTENDGLKRFFVGGFIVGRGRVPGVQLPLAGARECAARWPFDGGGIVGGGYRLPKPMPFQNPMP